MELGIVKQRDINTEVQRAYLDYAMSVIVSRALPDARDGLKPVQRRILFAMHDLHLRPDTPHKKSARIVGEVLGKYHPHGDSAVYAAMARMAQDFSLRNLLVDGQGNFGSIDGDAPAAMRYTEARLASVSMEVLADIDKQTVDWVDNFDGTLKEPSVLPSRLPNLIVNGASGIAVGMSTNIPPHNLGEVVDALIYMLEQWETLDDVDVEALMQFIQGPDFPTGGLIYRREKEGGENVLLKSYATGRGRIRIRARAHVEEGARGRQRLVITELPYQVNKSSLIEKIAKYVRAGKLEDIADLRDESDRQGLRIVIDLNMSADPDAVLESLYSRTRLEMGYSIIILALVDGEPRRLSLKRALKVFLDHRLEVLQRRSNFELTHARERAHIVEGLLTALDHLDEVIDTIRRSRRVDTAHTNLRRKFKLSDEQAQAILNMPLKRLAALERKKLQDEYDELTALIAELESLLRSPAKQRQTIQKELLELRDEYADSRRTHVLDVKGTKIEAEDLTPDIPVWVSVSREGRVARIPMEDASPPRAYARPEEAPLALLEASTRDALYLFTAKGAAVALPVHQTPDGVSWDGEGAPWSQLTRAENGDLVGALALPAEPPEDSAVFFATTQGQVKRIRTEELPAVGRELADVMRLDDDDRVVAALWVRDGDEVILGAKQGNCIRFEVDDVRPTGARAGGVNGMRLESGDEVVGAGVIAPEATVLVISDQGMGKRTPVSEFSSQRRGGKGMQGIKLRAKEHLADVDVIDDYSRCFPVTERGASKTVTGRSINEQGRATRGESVIALRSNDRVIDIVVQRAPIT